MSSTSAVEVSIHAVSPVCGAGASAAQASAGASRAKSAARRLEARASLAAVGIALSLNPVDRMTKRPLRRRSPARKLWLDARMTCAERVQIPCHCGFRSSFRGLRELHAVRCTVLELPRYSLPQFGALQGAEVRAWIHFVSMSSHGACS